MLLADLLLAADVQNRLVASFRFPSNTDLLLYSVSFAFHCMGPF